MHVTKTAHRRNKQYRNKYANTQAHIHSYINKQSHAYTQYHRNRNHRQ